MRNVKTTQAMKMIACATLGAILGNVALTFADNMASTSTVLSGGMVIPYEGYLMLDSTPMNVQGQEVQFELYDAPTGGTLQWGESQVVNIYNGKFSAPIGKGAKISSSPANATFDQVVLDAEKLFLSVKVKDVNGTFVELSGRQAIEAAPYAAWSANSSNFQVAGALGVQGNTNMGGSLDVNGGANVGGSLATNGDLTVGASAYIAGHDLVLGSNPARGNGGRALVEGIDTLLINYAADFPNGAEVQSSLKVNDSLTVNSHADMLTTNTDAFLPDYAAWNAHGTGDGGAAIYNDNASTKALMIVGNNSGGGARKIDLYDNVDINGNLDVTGTITGVGIAWINCETVSSTCADYGGGNWVFMDRHNTLSCPANKVMTSWDVINDCPLPNLRMTYTCCGMYLYDN